jgi:hypothetical protein
MGWNLEDPNRFDFMQFCHHNFSFSLLPFLSRKDMAAACACKIYLGSYKWMFAHDDTVDICTISVCYFPTIHIESVELREQKKNFFSQIYLLHSKK